MAVLLDGQTQARAQMGVNEVCSSHKKRRMNAERSTADKKNISPAPSLCRVQLRQSLTTGRLEPKRFLFVCS